MRSGSAAIIVIAYHLASAVILTEPAWCQSDLPTLALKPPIPEIQNPHVLRFRERDTDGDGILSESEYSIGSGRDRKSVQREFKVFDADRDGRMSLNEFLTVPVGQPEDQRGVIDDPVVQLAASRLHEIMKSWETWDADGDGSLGKSEFEAARIGSLVPGLESAGFGQWDQDVNDSVSRDDVARTLEIAYGVRTRGGALLRSNCGRVIDWNTFSHLKMGDDGMVTKEDYFAVLGQIDDKDVWLNSIDRNRDGRFDFAEYATGNHRTDPVGSFLGMDKDLDGVLSLQELDVLPDDWRRMAKCSFQGFDDDHDGAISLREYQLMPHCNLLAPWMSAVDANNDGLLPQFRFTSDIALTALSAEYFRRLDVNRDGALSLSEFPFVTSFKPPTELHVQTSDGGRRVLLFPNHEIIASPEISPDNKWVAVDGWSRNESPVASHLLFISLETGEIRDLGVGCMPNWSADGRRVAYCKYGQGVFIRNFEGSGTDEQRIDQQGWAIQFSTDGRHLAYVRGSNIVIQNVATREKRSVFAAGTNPYRHIEHNLEWSPDSERICFRGYRSNGDVEIGIVTATGVDPMLHVCCDGKLALPDFAWHPDGKHLMFPQQLAGEKGQIYEVDPDGKVGTVPIRYPDQPKDQNNSGLCWSRDGKLFAFVSTR